MSILSWKLSLFDRNNRSMCQVKRVVVAAVDDDDVAVAIADEDDVGVKVVVC